MSKRSTRQKRAIEEVLSRAKGPLSVRDIQVEAARVHSNVSLATIYRVVRDGAETGELSVVRLDDSIARYEVANRQHHHHFLCTSCSRAFDISLPCGLIANYAPTDFEVTRHEITLYGNCPDCVVN